MTPSNNLSVLPFYNNIELQNHKKSFAYNSTFQLLSPNRTILPFQIIRHSSSDPITNVILRSCSGGLSVDITSFMLSNGLMIIPDSTDNYDVIVWNGNNPLGISVPNQTYYLELVAGQIWYSDMFTFVGNSSKYMKVEWWDENTHYFDGGHIFYDGIFKHRMYLDTELGKPEYQFDETGNERDGYFFPEKQISEKTYKFTFIAPEYLTDAIRLIRLRDFIQITNNGQLFECDTFLANVRWQTQGDIASVEAEFESFTVVKKLPTISYSSPGTNVYNVYVISSGIGSYGSGQYSPGATVVINAGTPPAGTQFKNWATSSPGVVFGNVNSSLTSFVMPTNNVSVTAVFESIVQTFSVTVISDGVGYSGSGTYAVGSMVYVNAGTPPSGYQFSQWTTSGVILVIPTSSNNNFVMPANNVTLTANFIPVVDNKYLVTVTSEGSGSTGGGLYTPGSTVTIYAGTPPAGKTFIGWGTVSGIQMNDPFAQTTTFVMPSKAVTIEAVFGFPVTVVSASSTTQSEMGGGIKQTGSIVWIWCGVPPAGKSFSHWTTSSPGVTFNNPTLTTATFVMPNNSVTVTANFV